tara:strand:- start:37 stop:375 length:339 start_codon:yes stop_codon:yes gene_type:complete
MSYDTRSHITNATNWEDDATGHIFTNTVGENYIRFTDPFPVMRVNAYNVDCGTIEEYSKQIHERVRLINSDNTPDDVRKLVRQGSDLSLEDLQQITLSIEKKHDAKIIFNTH